MHTPRAILNSEAFRQRIVSSVQQRRRESNPGVGEILTRPGERQQARLQGGREEDRAPIGEQEGL